MKTLEIVAIAFLSILSFSCGSDDNSLNNTLPTTLDLLTSSSWYFESKSQEIIQHVKQKALLIL